jgi:SOS-response transcriptional repressor LexA
LNFQFVRKPKEVVELFGESLVFTEHFRRHLENEMFHSFLRDSIDYSIDKFERKLKNAAFKNGFILYEKYSRKDVCRILNWDLNEEATVYGYKLSNGTCPIFVNYHKEENIASSTKFPEKFLSNTQFLWYSKPNRKISNSTLSEIKDNWQNLRLPFFMKKSNGEGTDFYYMGDVNPAVESFEETTILNDKEESVPVVRVVLEMVTPVESAIFDYITQEQSLEETPSDSPFSPVQKSDTKVVTMVPLFDFYAAAGSFSEMQSNKDYTMIEVDGLKGNMDDYFVCKVIGESMNRVISNGALCLFKKYTGGTRNDKILLVELMDMQDPDFNSSFTVKTYSSSKKMDEEGRMVHEAIRLIPNSYAPGYSDILLNEEDGSSYRVVGEFVRVLES